MSRMPSLMWSDVVIRTSRRTSLSLQNGRAAMTTTALLSSGRRHFSTQEQVKAKITTKILEPTSSTNDNRTLEEKEGRLRQEEIWKAAQLRREERQRRHQELLAKQAAEKQQRLLENEKAKMKTTESEEEPLDEKSKRIRDMEKQQVLHKVLVQESRRQRHQQKSNNNSIEQAPKQLQYDTAAAAIPSWLSRSRDCFQMTMKALQTIGTHNDGGKISNKTSWTSDILVDNFRQLYHQSLSSFKLYLASGCHDNKSNENLPPQPLPPHLQDAMDQLVQAGFGDMTFVKTYQATTTSQDKVKDMRLELLRKEKAHQRDQNLLADLRAKLLNLKEEHRKQQQQQSIQTNEQKKPKTLMDWSQDIISFVFGRSKTGDDSATGTTSTVHTKATTASSSEDLNQMSSSDHIMHLERVVEQLDKKMTLRARDMDRLKEQLQRTLAVSLPRKQFKAAHSKVQQIMPDLCRGLAEHMKERFGTVIQAYQLLSSQTDLTRPHDWYLYARMNRRKIVFHGGPTNSGKTYSALQRLKTAEKGLYLGPLRLLAAEIYDTLTMQGIYCNLMTGQEKREVPFSTHSACTIEMASAETEYDVVVIDEIQMIADESRGYAWTKALLSLRCQEIHVCGGLEAKDIVRKIAEACGDEFVLHTYKRFSDLRIAQNSISRTPNELGSYKSVQPGDCVVAFSRNDIFAIKREIEKATKYKCCVIYGSLPPQTRSEQARRFNDPDSGYDILVSSDAIGMGLNLNIRRIIFHTIFKSNGERIVRLDHSAVKQIAGRAGRRNSPFPDGEVTCRDPRDMEYLKQCMNSEIKPLRQAGLMPTAAHIELFHAALQAGIGDVQAPTQLHQLLPMFNEMAVVQGNYFLCRQNDMQLIAKILSKYDLPLSEKYTFCMAPIDSSAAIPMNTLRNFAQKRVECAEAGLPWRDVPRQAKSFDDLSYLCTIYSQLELFLWLQNKFNRNALEIQTALARKEATTAFINTALRDAEKLKLNHCYLKRDRAIRAKWQELNRRSRGISNEKTQQLGVISSNNMDFGVLDGLLLPANDDKQTSHANDEQMDDLLFGDDAMSNVDDLLDDEMELKDENV